MSLELDIEYFWHQPREQEAVLVHLLLHSKVFVSLRTTTFEEGLWICLILLALFSCVEQLSRRLAWFAPYGHALSTIKAKGLPSSFGYRCSPKQYLQWSCDFREKIPNESLSNITLGAINVKWAWMPTRLDKSCEKQRFITDQTFIPPQDLFLTVWPAGLARSFNQRENRATIWLTWKRYVNVLMFIAIVRPHWCLRPVFPSFLPTRASSLI